MKQMCRGKEALILSLSKIINKIFKTPDSEMVSLVKNSSKIKYIETKLIGGNIEIDSSKVATR